MITKDAIETAYSFFHQKERVYAHSTLDWQRDDIEYAVGEYSSEMNPELYRLMADGRSDFLRDHSRFASDIVRAIDVLDGLLALR